MAVARRPAASTGHVLFLAILCATTSSFPLPSAMWRSNLVEHQSCSSTAISDRRPRYPSPFSTPAERITSGNTPMRMLSVDGTGEQQQDVEHRQQEHTTPVLPQTLGNGRYIVRDILGTGSTASTYRCTTLPPSPPQQQAEQDQGRSKEGATNERLERQERSGWCARLPSRP